MAAPYPPALETAIGFLASAFDVEHFESDPGDALISLYELRDDHETQEQVASSLADLVMYVCQGLVEAAEPPEWRAGGAVGQRVWIGLLTTRDGRVPELQFWIGECLAWWHEFQLASVVDAARPSPSLSTPAVDSLSLLSCEPSHSLRAVQAKATLRTPRWHCVQAMVKFKRHQAGQWDDAWNDSLRHYRHSFICEASSSRQRRITDPTASVISGSQRD